MVKKKKNRVLIGSIIIILSVVAIFSIIATNPDGFKFLSVTGQGMTITSISNIGALTPDTDLSGKWMLINARSSGGQSLVATINPSQTESLGLGYQTEYPLTIEMESSDEQVHYKIRNTGTNIYSYELLTQQSTDSCEKNFYIPFTGGSDAPLCPSDHDWKIDLYNNDASWDNRYICRRLCINKVQEGVSSVIEPASVKKSVKMVLTASGERIEQEIEVGRSANFYSNSLGLVATVQFPDLLWTGNYPPSGQGYKGYHQIDSGKWTITTDERLNNYIGKSPSLENYLNSLVSGGNIFLDKFSTSTFNLEVGKVNNVVTSMQGDNVQIGGSLTNIENIDGETYATIDADAKLGVADLVIRLRADWVGIKIPFGKPDIVSAQCPDFKSGENGEIILQVKNTGTATGSFVPSIECSSVSQSYNMGITSIASLQTKTMTIPIDTGAFAGEKLDTCKIKVEDFNNPDNYDEASATCQLLKPALCIENEIYTSGNCISKCVDGAKTELMCCNNTAKLSYNPDLSGDEFNGFYCVTDDGGDNGLGYCSDCDAYAKNLLFGWAGASDCKAKIFQGTFFCIFALLRLLAVPFFFIISILFGYNAVNKIMKGDFKVLSWSLAIIIGGLVGVLTYFAFYVGLVLLIVLGLIKLFIGFIPGLNLPKRLRR